MSAEQEAARAALVDAIEQARRLRRDYYGVRAGVTRAVHLARAAGIPASVPGVLWAVFFPHRRPPFRRWRIDAESQGP